MKIVIFLSLLGAVSASVIPEANPIPVAPIVSDQPAPVAVPVVSAPVVPAAPIVAPVVEPIVPAESAVAPVVVAPYAPVPAPAVPAPVIVDTVSGVEVPEPDLGLSAPIEQAQKLLIVLDSQVKKLLPEVVAAPVVPADGSVVVDQYAGGLEPAVGNVVDNQEATVRQINQISSLLDQIDRVEKRLSQTIDSLADRRRYILSNGLRPVLGYVQRVQSDLNTLNRRLTGGTSNQASSAAAAAVAAVSKQGGAGSPSGAPVDQTALDAIRNTVAQINTSISDLVSRIRNAFNFPAVSNIFSGSSSTTGRPINVE